MPRINMIADSLCPFARIMEEKLVKRLVQMGIRTMTAHQIDRWNSVIGCSHYNLIWFFGIAQSGLVPLPCNFLLIETFKLTDK